MSEHSGLSPSGKAPHTGFTAASSSESGLANRGGEDALQQDHGRGDLGAFRLDREPISATTKRAQVRGILEHLIETELWSYASASAESPYARRLQTWLRPMFWNECTARGHTSPAHKWIRDCI